MDRMSLSGPPRGLTLLELLVVLAVLAVLAALMVPGFQTLRQAVSIRLEAGRLLQAVSLARSEAMFRGEAVTLCPTAPDPAGDTEHCRGTYSQGWMLYANPGALAQPVTAEQILQRWPGRPNLTIVNRAGTQLLDARVSWRADGTARRNLTFMVCSRQKPSLASWSLVLNRLGRPRLARGWGDCNASV
ncbi:MAG: hypothetical protein CME38_17665 [Haliea sp.]|nr:hypothetical protein [Haliea sp.]